MDSYAVYLRPRGSLASPLPSDTLFGAVCWALVSLELTDVSAMLKDFSPSKFAFSSTFPVYGIAPDGKSALLRSYPCPIMPGLSPQDIRILAGHIEDTEQQRAGIVDVVEKEKNYLKKAIYVSEGLFKEIVENNLSTLGIYNRLAKKGFRNSDIESAGEMLFLTADRKQAMGKDSLPDLSRLEAIQHNQVDRVMGSSVEGLLFFEEETFFTAGAGLWCVARVQDDRVKRMLEAAFRYLSDTGLGANRTTGKGHFDIMFGEDLQLPDAGENANAWITLSHYLPVENEVITTKSPLRYSLETVWAKREHKFIRSLPGVTSYPVYKEVLRMFVPGSVFPLVGRNEIYGQLTQVVRPESNGGVTVWQSGLAVPVFAKVQA